MQGANANANLEFLPVTEVTSSSAAGQPNGAPHHAAAAAVPAPTSGVGRAFTSAERGEDSTKLLGLLMTNHQALASSLPLPELQPQLQQQLQADPGLAFLTIPSAAEQAGQAWVQAMMQAGDHASGGPAQQPRADLGPGALAQIAEATQELDSTPRPFQAQTQLASCKQEQRLQPKQERPPDSPGSGLRRPRRASARYVVSPVRPSLACDGGAKLLRQLSAALALAWPASCVSMLAAVSGFLSCVPRQSKRVA